MKKIMIALLAIAVLFGFAACDNTTTPSGDEEQTGAVTSGMTKDVIDMVMNGSFENVTPAAGNLNARIGAMLGAGTTAKDMVGNTGYTLEVSASAPMTATISHQIAAAEGTTYPAQTETLVINGMQVGETADKTFALNSFTYTYEGYTYDSSNSIVPVKVELDGWFGNTALVVTYATDTVDTSKITSYKLPDSSSVSVAIGADSEAVSVIVDNVAADSAVAFDTISLSYGGYSYKNYVATKSQAAQKAAKGYVDLLTAEAVADVLTTWIDDGFATGTWTTEYSPATGGSAKFTLTPASETAFVGSTANLKLDANDTLEITFAGSGTADASQSFDAKTFSIKGTFNAYTTGTTAETAFAKEITINVSGEFSNADSTHSLKITKNNSSNAVATVVATSSPNELTIKYTDGVVATMSADVKPELRDATLTTAPTDKVVALSTDTVELSHPFPTFS